MNAYRWASVALAVVLLAGGLRAADEIEVIAIAKVGDGSATAKAWDELQAAALKASVGRPFQATPADWLVQIKPMPCPEARGAKMYSCAGMAESTGKDGAVLRYSTLQTSESSDWIAVKEGAGSGPDESAFAQQLAMMRAFLKKAGQPLSDAQEQKLAALMQFSYPEADQAWAQAKAKPEDKARAAAFVRACLKARDAYQTSLMAASEKMMA
ncbi:MAG: hypothetical protein KIS92_24670, partial [Planctomycetota bacterium]|nr:hypothetical protein [Planctomycetota bacterium]